jgi:H+/Cl- antiporter ClcA
MHYRASLWILQDNYDPFWVIIGAILFGLLFGYYIWIYYKFSRKDSESAPQKKLAYNHKKVLEHT